MCVRRGTPKGISFSAACWFRFTKDYREGYELATSYAELSAGGYKVKLSPRNPCKVFRLNDMVMTSRQMYHRPLKLTAEKMKDIRSLVDACAGSLAKERYWNKILGAPTGESPPDNDEYDENDTGGFGDIFDYQ